MEKRAIRPWYRIHRSTLVVLAIAAAWLVFINIPGNRGERVPIASKFYHGWPYWYFEREGSEFDFWSFKGTSTRFYLGALLLNVGAALCIVALVACAAELWIRRYGRLWRFSVTSLLVVTAVLAGVLGLMMRDVRQCYRQQQSLRELAALGTLHTARKVREYDWFRSFFGDYLAGTVGRVTFKASQPIDRLPDLRALESMVWLELELSSVPENFEQLAELSKLKHLCITLTALGAEDRERLTALTTMPKLWELALIGDDFDDDAVGHISRDSSLVVIAIDSTKITEQGLNRLSELKSLQMLKLDESVIQNHDCSVISEFPRLSSVYFIGKSLTVQDEQKMRSIWPNAKTRVGASFFTTISPVVEQKSIWLGRD